MSCRSAALPHLPAFVQGARLAHLCVTAPSHRESRALDPVLPLCTTLTRLECSCKCLPGAFPPGLQHLTIQQVLASDEAWAARDMQRLFPRLSHLGSLQHLHLRLGQHVQLPAYLAAHLPPSLRSLHLSFWCEEDEDPDDSDSELTFDKPDLSALARCQPGVQVTLSINAGRTYDPEGVFCSTCLLPALLAAGPLHRLALSLGEGWAKQVLPTLAARLQYDGLTLQFCPDADGAEMGPVAALPACSNLGLLCADPQLVMRFTWEALAACPRCCLLGSSAMPLRSPVVVTGFPGRLPSFAWALVVCGDVSFVGGLPRSQFERAAPGVHLLRSQAAAHLSLADLERMAAE